MLSLPHASHFEAAKGIVIGLLSASAQVVFNLTYGPCDCPQSSNPFVFCLVPQKDVTTFRHKQERVQARGQLWIWNPWRRAHVVQNRSNPWLHKMGLGPTIFFKKISKFFLWKWCMSRRHLHPRGFAPWLQHEGFDYILLSSRFRLWCNYWHEKTKKFLKSRAMRGECIRSNRHHFLCVKFNIDFLWLDIILALHMIDLFSLRSVHTIFVFVIYM